jgi:antitoxin CptB
MDPARLKRVRHRAWRRGFREADLILGPFADSRVRDLSADDLDRFEALLEESDQDIYAWVMGTKPIPTRLDNEIMAALRAFCGAV